MRFLSILCTFFLLVPPAFAEETPNYNPPKIPIKDVITKIPETSVDFLSRSFSRQAIPAWAAILSSTAVLYHYDSDIYENVQHLGHRWGLSNVDKTKTVVSYGQFDLLRLPTDTESAIYFMGDGWTDMIAAAGFFADGYFAGHNRAYNTSLEMLHGMTVTMFIDQFLKHSFGRQSPSERTEPRGKWTPYASWKAYNHHTSGYDAMPSGHMMTATVVFTIIRGNYPDYDKFLLPLECTWLTVLGFGMVNNGVHWAGDYPLGFAIGYVVAKSTLKTFKVEQSGAKDTAWNWQFAPGVSADGTTTLTASATF